MDQWKKSVVTRLYIIWPRANVGNFICQISSTKIVNQWLFLFLMFSWMGVCIWFFLAIFANFWDLWLAWVWGDRENVVWGDREWLAWVVMHIFTFPTPLHVPFRVIDKKNFFADQNKKNKNFKSFNVYEVRCLFFSQGLLLKLHDRGGPKPFCCKATRLSEVGLLKEMNEEIEFRHVKLGL